MLRKLLTLLALCAGLAALGEPARAAVSPLQSARQVEAARLACGPTTAPTPAPTRQGTLRMEGKTKPCPKPTVILVVPTVMLHADRARE